MRACEEYFEILNPGVVHSSLSDDVTHQIIELDIGFLSSYQVMISEGYWFLW